MAKRIPECLFPFLLAVSFLLSLSSCQKKTNTEQDTIQVFAAASLQEALEEIGSLFSSETGLALSYNFAGSNVLAQQIVASSIADVYISADGEWMDFVERADKLGENTRIDLLENTLVAVCSLEAPWKVDDPESLCELDFRFLCIGDPVGVPAGKYARDFLSKVPCNGKSAWEIVQGRLSPAPDVRAALAQVRSRPDAIGIVYRTDYLLYREELRRLFDAPETEIRYPAAMTLKGMEKQSAGRFFVFLQSEEARLVFERFGFLNPYSAGD